MPESLLPSSHDDIPINSILKAVVERQDIPPDLTGKIRDKIASHDKQKSSPHFGIAWQWVAAASIVICIAGWAALKHAQPVAPFPALADRSGQDIYIRNLSTIVPTVLRVGLGDHLHCSVFRKYPENPPSLDEMKAKLGPSYEALIPAVEAAAPSGYRVIMAHRCSYMGRKFVHLTLADGQKLMSLVIAQRQENESMRNLQPAAQNGDLRIYQSSTGNYQVASFETASQFAFVVSELPSKESLAVTQAMSTDVLQVLREAKG